jgi:pyrroline-5-carboxylate reductase
VKPLVFLGGGRITSALVAGLRLSGYKSSIWVHDRHAQKLRRMMRESGITPAPALKEAVLAAGILVIAVRPDTVKPLVEEIRRLNSPAIAVSLAAGVPLRQLRLWSGPSISWVRAMPSPVARYAKGLTALAYDRGLGAGEKREVRSLFTRVGSVIEIPENQFDAFTVAYSSSHGYHALAALSQAAKKLGLPRHIALMAASHALADGIAAWRSGTSSLGELLHEAATPGGIAATVMNAMDQRGYKATVEAGLHAGIARARKNVK